MNKKNQKETRGFQAEVKQVLNLVINSLYSHKEIFLRELISNASDALDKLRFNATQDDSLYAGDSELRIRISYDKEARTITVSDNGIGMTYDEVIDNIGTIAKSGTKEFFSKLTGDAVKDSSLIGQFGVGFYSAFIVADKVELFTKKAGCKDDEAIHWVSDGVGEYTIEKVSKKDRGTQIILHLKPEEDEMLSNFWLKNVIKKYSDHIMFPIQMQKEEWDADKGEMLLSDEFETVNQANALWTRPKSEITEEQYNEFYKHIAHDFEDPLTYSHNKVEGRTEYIQLLYIPSHPPMDLMNPNKRHGLKLFVRRVFIMDDAEQLIPNYLRFVRGIVDSSDLPLNVSREILQHSRDVKAIREGCTKRVLSMLEDLVGNQPEKYATFWKNFGSLLKEGVGEDFANQQRMAKLFRFSTTHTDSEEQTVSLDDYIARMQPDQDKIYYITSENFLAAKNSPHLEVFRKKGIEVLILSERIDEWLVGYLTEYDGKPLQSVMKGALDLPADETEKAEQEKIETENKPLIEKIKETLGDKVEDVRTTARLTESPACLVAPEVSLGVNLERILKAAGQPVPSSKPTLEINPKHPVFERLRKEDGDFDDWVNLLFDQARLAEGTQLEDPATFVQRMNRLMLKM